MYQKSLQALLAQLNALKTLQSSSDFNAGVDAAIQVVSGQLQHLADRERMEQLEAELQQLRTKYLESPKARRGRRPKVEQPNQTEQIAAFTASAPEEPVTKPEPSSFQ